jgi:hypothetical protein
MRALCSSLCTLLQPMSSNEIYSIVMGALTTTVGHGCHLIDGQEVEATSAKAFFKTLPWNLQREAAALSLLRVSWSYTALG